MNHSPLSIQHLKPSLPQGDATEATMLRQWYNDLITLAFDAAQKAADAQRANQFIQAIEWGWKSKHASLQAKDIDGRILRLYFGQSEELDPIHN